VPAATQKLALRYPVSGPAGRETPRKCPLRGVFRLPGARAGGSLCGRTRNAATPLQHLWDPL